MLIVVFEVNILLADGDSFKCAGPADTHLGVGVHVVSVIVVFSNTSGDWRMVQNLLRKVSKVRPDKLVSFTENRVERLIRSTISAFVLGNTKCSD